MRLKLKDILSKISENKRNGQLTTCLKKNSMKQAGITKEDLLNMKIDTKLKKLLMEE